MVQQCDNSSLTKITGCKPFASCAPFHEQHPSRHTKRGWRHCVDSSSAVGRRQVDVGFISCTGPLLLQESLQKATLSRLSRTHGRQNRKQQLDKHKRGAGAPGSGLCTAPREHKHCRRPRFVMMAPSMCFFQHRRTLEPSTHLTGELPIAATYCYCIGLTWCWERTRRGV